jgi:hypothetical protein
MSKVKSLLKRAWTEFTNPGQEQRVRLLQQAIAHGFQTKKSAFNLDEVLSPHQFNPTDLKVATKAYYQMMLQRLWENGLPEPNQRQLLAVIAEKLRLPPDEVKQLNEEVASIAFAGYLAEALEDGVLTSSELETLQSVASFAGTSVKVFVSRNASRQGISILRGLFAEATSTGILDQTLWQNLQASADTLGLGRKELLEAVVPLAKSFAEHVLADVKSDGVLTDEEDRYLKWLIETFRFEPEFKDYIERELRFLKERELISSGNLPQIKPPKGLNLQPGEAVFFCGQCEANITRNLKAGTTDDLHYGKFVLTDSRVIFESDTKPLSIPFRAIISWDGWGNNLALTVRNKPAMVFTNHEPDPLFVERFKASLQLNNQTLVRRSSSQPDRHIPREVRQRVWQRYSGKCAECGATEYLEFDHIVPVAKGGSNSDQNVQLLCRKCNLQKSDKI